MSAFRIHQILNNQPQSGEWQVDVNGLFPFNTCDSGLGISLASGQVH